MCDYCRNPCGCDYRCTTEYPPRRCRSLGPCDRCDTKFSDMVPPSFLCRTASEIERLRKRSCSCALNRKKGIKNAVCNFTGKANCRSKGGPKEKRGQDCATECEVVDSDESDDSSESSDASESEAAGAGGEASAASVAFGAEAGGGNGANAGAMGAAGYGASNNWNSGNNYAGAGGAPNGYQGGVAANGGNQMTVHNMPAAGMPSNRPPQFDPCTGREVMPVTPCMATMAAVTSYMPCLMPCWPPQQFSQNPLAAQPNAFGGAMGMQQDQLAANTFQAGDTADEQGNPKGKSKSKHKSKSNNGCNCLEELAKQQEKEMKKAQAKAKNVCNCLEELAKQQEQEMKKAQAKNGCNCLEELTKQQEKEKKKAQAKAEAKAKTGCSCLEEQARQQEKKERKAQAKAEAKAKAECNCTDAQLINCTPNDPKVIERICESLHIPRPEGNCFLLLPIGGNNMSSGKGKKSEDALKGSPSSKRKVKKAKDKDKDATTAGEKGKADESREGQAGHGAELAAGPCSCGCGVNNCMKSTRSCGCNATQMGSDDSTQTPPPESVGEENQCENSCTPSPNCCYYPCYSYCYNPCTGCYYWRNNCCRCNNTCCNNCNASNSCNACNGNSCPLKSKGTSQAGTPGAPAPKPKTAAVQPSKGGAKGNGKDSDERILAGAITPFQPEMQEYYDQWLQYQQYNSNMHVGYAQMPRHMHMNQHMRRTPICYQSPRCMWQQQQMGHGMGHAAQQPVDIDWTPQ
ncbi:maker749 [Drosophila busckii]|uniref:Maker749 n=1 Tax=Drosophila busckii TaxID=30019 RepID=A0A0M4EIP2_DROBS|nr:maker749 [Drosophila busckii]